MFIIFKLEERCYHYRLKVHKVQDACVVGMYFLNAMWMLNTELFRSRMK